MANFRVGQKVVCVDDAPRMLPTTMGPFSTTALKVSLPVKSNVYVVRGFHPKQPGLYVQEITNFHVSTEDKLELPLAIDRFKPLISQADDVEMFRRISEDSLGRLEVLEDVLNEQYLCDETHE